MPLLWKSQTDFHNSLEISHRTRDSHIPTADPDSYELTSEQAKSVTDVSGPICYRSFRLRTRGPVPLPVPPDNAHAEPSIGDGVQRLT